LEPDDDVEVEVDEGGGFFVSAFLFVSSAFLVAFLPFLPSPVTQFF